MEVLGDDFVHTRSSRWPGRRQLYLHLCLIAVIAAPLIVVWSCSTLGGPPLEKPWFPHGPHMGERMLRCEMCHGVQSGEEQLTLPTPELCALCHEQVDKGKPPEERIAARFDDSGDLRRSVLVRLPEEIRFAHRDHLTGSGLECTSCHPDPDAPRDMSTTMLQKRDCMGCHASSPTTDTVCSTCHESIDANWRPPTHGPNWKHGEHGLVMREGHGGAHADVSIQRCDLCHDETESCQACHRVESPRNHDNYFRIRGHGLLASMDRSRCDTCHKRDACEQCHSETRPISHRGGFGNPSQRHCNGCHFPVQAQGCVVCHKGTPSHAQATPLPPGHSAAMNCRMCHGNGQPLPHPDGGHACTICHR